MIHDLQTSTLQLCYQKSKKYVFNVYLPKQICDEDTLNHSMCSKFTANFCL